jgi:hypothetical protein
VILTRRQVAALWIKHGGPPDEAGRAAEVATKESNRDTNAVNTSSGATGLMQIHPGGAQYKDPDVNMRTAVGKFKASGGWAPWEVCGFQNSCPNIPKTVNAGLLDNLPDIPNPLDLLPDTPDVPNPLGSLFEPLSNIAEILKGFMQTWFELVKKIADPNTWKDAGKILLGLIMLTIGLRRIFTVVT